jgi:hypothetical protein
MKRNESHVGTRASIPISDKEIMDKVVASVPRGTLRGYQEALTLLGQDLDPLVVLLVAALPRNHPAHVAVVRKINTEFGVAFGVDAKPRKIAKISPEEEDFIVAVPASIHTEVRGRLKEMRGLSISLYQEGMAVLGVELDPMITATLMGLQRNHPSRVAAIKRINEAFLTLFGNLPW